MNTTKVIFTGWQQGMKKVSLAHALHDYAGLSFTQSKLNVDAIVNNITVDVICPNHEAATSLLSAAQNLGAQCKIEFSF